MIWGILFIAISTIIVIVGCADECESTKSKTIAGFLAGWIGLSGVLIFVFHYMLKNIPEAIDVYRGKTELVIHYEQRDSIMIPTDSIVVFKK